MADIEQERIKKEIFLKICSYMDDVNFDDINRATIKLIDCLPSNFPEPRVSVSFADETVSFVWRESKSMLDISIDYLIDSNDIAYTYVNVLTNEIDFGHLNNRDDKDKLPCFLIERITTIGSNSSRH